MSAGRTGRPLRFMGVVLGGWIATRIWWLWPVAAPLAPGGLRAVVPLAITAAATASPARSRILVSVAVPPPAVRRAPHAPAYASAPVRQTAPPLPAPMLARPPLARHPDPNQARLGLLGMIRYGAPAPPPPGASRWSGSAWSILRGGRQRAGVATPQLGGSQIGARLAYALDAHRRLAIALRVSSAIAVRQQEAAIALEWQPRGLPVRLALERRVGVAGMRGGTALGVSGGVSERPLAAGFRLDGYAQAGAIARDGVEGYADGAVRIARPLWRERGGALLDLGVGAWGAAQRGAARLDVGPSAAMTLPLGARRVRVTLDWRERVAGNARPASGPAVSLGTDF